MTGVLHAEYTKIRTRPATWMALTVALTAHTVFAVLAATDVVRVAGRNGLVPVADLGGLLLAPAYVLVAIAVFAGGGEFPGGQIRVSLLAVPDRGRLFTAKTVVTALVSVVAAVLVLAPAGLVRHATGADFGALVTAHLLLAFVGYGLAILTRTTVTPLAVLPLAAFLVAPVLRGSFPALVRYLPHDAALSLAGLADDPAALGRTGGLPVLTGWAVAFLIAARVAVTRRDT